MVENDLITLDELKGGFTTMFEKEFNIHSFLAPILSNGIMIFQMYYYSDMPDLQEKYFGFFMGYIVYKLVQLLTSYYQSSYSGKIQNFYLNKNYEGMNLTYKKCLIMSIIIHAISYFPIKWIVMYIFTNTYLTKQNPEFVGGSIFKVGQYITIHFWAVLFACLTTALSQILSLLKYDNYVTYGNIIRIAVNIIFGIFYRKKYGDDYFVRGLSYADVIGELCVGIYLIIMQNKLNPLSQDYLSFNMEIIQNAIKTVSEVLNINGFIFYFLLNFYDEIFMLSYVYFFVKDYEVSWYNFYFICFIFKNMFFKIPRNDQLNIYSFNKKIYNESIENINPSQINYDFDSKAQVNKNYEWMFYIKSKIINTLALNIFMAIIYILFYLFRGFYIVDITKQNFLVIILFGINGIIEQLGLFIKNAETLIFSDNQSFNALWMGVGVSFVCFIFMYLVTHSMAGVVLVIYLTYYYIFFKFYPLVKNADMKIININVISSMEKNDEEQKNEITDTPNSSFERVDVSLVKKQMSNDLL
jgi:hypothetical protein